MLAGAGALSLVAKLCGDADTVTAIQAGDPAALHQVEDAFRCLTAIGDRLHELGPTPRRLRAIGDIAHRAFAIFGRAADAFGAACDRGIGVEGMEHVNRSLHEGAALLGELRDRPELRSEPDVSEASRC